MEHQSLYPIKCYPQLLKKVWGGEKLVRMLNKQGSGRLGESWELSGVEGYVSVVSNGNFKGKPLDFLIRDFGAHLLGEKVAKRFGETFPLLFKFIDAAQDLSVQLHPDDGIAMQRHQSFGKTEMWYILQADEKSRLILGFNQQIDKKGYLKKLSEGMLTDLLKEVPVTKGDAFFIAPGTVHAIGGGILLAEIQQTSDITYRIYDWNRPDDHGQMRQLHTEEALEVIDFSEHHATLSYRNALNESVVLCESPYFVTSKLELSHSVKKSYRGIDSFVVYMCVGGAGFVSSGKHSVSLEYGETLLLPAALKEVAIDTQGMTILEIYVP